MPIDSGTELRHFYTAKASRRERNVGLEGMPDGVWRCTCGALAMGHDNSGCCPAQGNDHPTCKPVAIMRHLVRLVTPPGGTVYDPFTGSGTTGMACVLEGVQFVGSDLSEHYLDIARHRIAHVQRHGERWLQAAGKQGPTGTGKTITKGAMNVRECVVCGSRAKQSGPDGRWPNCDHDEWSWVPTFDNAPDRTPPPLSDLPLFAVAD